MGGMSPGALLKFRLLAEGLKIDSGARDRWVELYGGPLTLAEYATTSGVALVLPEDLYVNAPLNHSAAPELRCDEDVFFVSHDDRDVPVRAIPVPGFHGQTQLDLLDGSVQPHTNYGVTHTDRCRVSPIAGCAWKCKFCDLPYEFAYRKRHPQNLLNVIRLAQHDALVPARHVLISGGTPRRGRPGESDEEWIDGVYEFLARHSPLPVDVMMPPRRDLEHPQRLASMGVHSVSLNMEVYDPERARALAPAKAHLGREHYLRCIERAVESFGIGRVQSLIVLGASVEPLESTLRGVRDLVERGCIPVLSPFRPNPITPMGRLRGATFEEMVEAYQATLDICEQVGNGVLPGPRCVPCHHNTVTLPDASGFYVGLDADISDRCLAC